jgi:hypothetical protein
MKMFKKIMAVALTAVMAVSMLTGCAIGDAVHEKQLLKALNDAGTTTKDAAGNYHKYVKDNKVTVNGVDYKLSEKATAVAKELATAETTKNDFTNAGAVKNLTAQCGEGKYVVVAVVVPTSGDYKWNKLADDANNYLSVGYTATADTKDVKEISVAMETRTTKKAAKDGKEYDVIVIVAAAKPAKV